jgi:hypothetical protein
MAWGDPIGAKPCPLGLNELQGFVEKLNILFSR